MTKTKVVHSIPGRCRVRLKGIWRQGEYAQYLQNFLASNPEITGVRLNRAAASLVISYQPETIAPSEMESLVMKLMMVGETGRRGDGGTSGPLDRGLWTRGAEEQGGRGDGETGDFPLSLLSPSPPWERGRG